MQFDLTGITNVGIHPSSKIFVRMKNTLSLFKALAVICCGSFLQYSWAQSDTLNIVAAGDSITGGFGPGVVNSYRFEFEALMQANECNYAMRGSQLTTDSNSTYESPHEGYPGWRAIHFVDGFQPGGPRAIGETVAIEEPDVMLLIMGSNELNGTGPSPNESPDQTLDNIRRVIERINSKADELDFARPTILLARPIPWLGASDDNPNILADIESLGLKIADAVTNGFPVAPSSNTRQPLLSNVFEIDTYTDFTSPMLLPDGIHPNATGEKFIAQAFFQGMVDAGLCEETNVDDADFIPPQTFISNPLTDNAQLAGTISFTGSTTDQGNSGIKRVRIAISKRNSEDTDEDWFTFGSTGGFDETGGFHETSAGIRDNTGTQANWLIRVPNLPDGGPYTLYALGVDGAGNEDFDPSLEAFWPTQITFNIVSKFCNGELVTVDLASGGIPTSLDDVILGTTGNDSIIAMGGNDTICGLGGDDTISGGRGLDWVDAGPGNDTVDGGNDADTIFGDTGLDTINGGPGDDELYGEDDDDIIKGNSGNDTLYGGAGIDRLIGSSGNDVIHTGPGGNRNTGIAVDGGAGNDVITGGPDDDEIRGATGNDTINGGGGNDALFGGGGNDTINGQAGDDLIRGNGSKDLLSGGNGNDDIDGGSEVDTIYGGNGNDTIRGSTGNDLLFGGADDDDISGGGGADSLFGNRGNDMLFGGGSNDSLSGGSDSDVCDGQAGIDSASSCETTTNIP